VLQDSISWEIKCKGTTTTTTTWGIREHGIRDKDWPLSAKEQQQQQQQLEKLSAKEINWIFWITQEHGIRDKDWPWVQTIYHVITRLPDEHKFEFTCQDQELHNDVT
jgi:hypothetical protein